ncbi:transposase [Thiotrichales bacterium 19X7-9]|nr:transposase [Thiotrichales bacterium 19X7-9]
MTLKQYTEEFKKEAVKLLLESDQPKPKIASNLGVKYSTLMTWYYKSMKKKSTPRTPTISVDYKSRYQDLIDENQKLKNSLKQAEQERDILKKATVDSMGHCNI